jgi:hypothetical protein
MARFALLIIFLSLFQAGCSSKVDTPESILWINGTHAVLTKVNRGDINRFGTFAQNSSNKKEFKDILESSWGVTSKQELEDMIDTLAVGRHNVMFLLEAQEYGITDMSRAEFEYELGFVNGRELVMYFRNMFEAYQAYREKAILGWDLSRATQLCAFGYVADYYSYDEAVNKALAIGRIIQDAFGSWDDFYASYFYGYAYWSEDDLEDPQSDYSKRVKILSDIKADSNSPLNLAWYLDLSK